LLEGNGQAGAKHSKSSSSSSSSSCRSYTVTFDAKVHLPCRTLPALARPLLVQQVRRLVQPALHAVYSQQQQTQVQQHTGLALDADSIQVHSRPFVAIASITPALPVSLRCAADHVCVTFTVQALAPSPFPIPVSHVSSSFSSSSPCSSATPTCLDCCKQGEMVMESGLGNCVDLVTLVGGAPRVTWKLQPGSPQPGSPPMQPVPHQPPSMQLASHQQRQLALDLPYAGYKLVDAFGQACERPQKHPFALSRVYYAPNELPAGEKQVNVKLAS